MLRVVLRGRQRQRRRRIQSSIQGASAFQMTAEKFLDTISKLFDKWRNFSEAPKLLPMSEEECLEIWEETYTVIHQPAFFGKENLKKWYLQRDGRKFHLENVLRAQEAFFSQKKYRGWNFTLEQKWCFFSQTSDDTMNRRSLHTNKRLWNNWRALCSMCSDCWKYLVFGKN